ncbi:MAG: hypothetical protein A3I66_00105 [Burkholderiales bacterium RIFCSPLOWO2_02_FULL_57_36]|nr:MAG: hypothetical protein A3I66_00105 [Burkholderiales bacterium RIFCSPLOWO2_02_FULL_57_36]
MAVALEIMHMMNRSFFASLDAKTQIRLRMTALAAGDYAANLVIMLGFAISGAVSWDIPLKILAVAVVFNIIFMTAIASGLSLRFRDPSLTAIQTYAAWGMILLGIFLAPQISYIFILYLIVPMSFASLHFSRRMLWLAWLFLMCALGFVMWIVGGAMANNVATLTERALFWAGLAIVFARFVASNAEIAGLRARLQEKNKALSAMTSQLTAATGKLVELANHDELTGLLNRREFMRRLHEELMRSERRKSVFCVAIIDVDHFKRVNDEYGHLIGDAVLSQLARQLGATQRGTDTVARYGGEEFTLLLVDADADAAAKGLERMRSSIERFDWEPLTPGRSITISAGIAAWQAGDTDERILNRADAALYAAKNSGRNCVKKAVAIALNSIEELPQHEACPASADIPAQASD